MTPDAAPLVVVGGGPISLVQLTDGMRGRGVGLGLVLSGGIPDGLLAFPFPVLAVDRPEHLQDAVGTAYEHGVALSAP